MFRWLSRSKTRKLNISSDVRPNPYRDFSQLSLDELIEMTKRSDFAPVAGNVIPLYRRLRGLQNDINTSPNQREIAQVLANTLREDILKALANNQGQLALFLEADAKSEKLYEVANLFETTGLVSPNSPSKPS